MFTKLLISARLLLVIPVVGLLGASLALFAKGLRLVFERLDDALLTSTIGEDLSPFEVSVLEGINLLLVGAGCLILAIGMFSLFVKPLKLPPVMRVESFHHLKGQFANFVILAMAVTFLESLSNLQVMMHDPKSNGSEIFYAGAGMALVTLALLAFKYWGGESHPSPFLPRPTAKQGQASEEASAS
ncbi:MAG: YqhA family protein [Cyanobacteriota bacterium]|nr:YqhA family protein [Cyanobacteriota bacterium]